MRKTKLFVTFVLLLLCLRGTSVAQSKSSDGTIVERAPCAVQPKRTYEQYSEEIRKRSQEEAALAKKQGIQWSFEQDYAGRLMNKDEFERRQSFTGYDCEKIKYLSDGLKVVGFISKPKNAEGKKLPLVIVNRGGNRESGKLSPQDFYYFYPFITNGFVVIGSQYRGVDGGEGREEFGGADVNDILNLIPLARSLGYVDMNNVFMVGSSRGTMMTFQAIKRGIPVNAAAAWGSVPDYRNRGKRHAALIEEVFRPLIPDFDKNPEEALKARSAIEWADKINVPLFLAQGGADWRSGVTPVLEFAQKLQSLGKTYELIVYAGDDHGIYHNRVDRERRTIEWFKKHSK
jgi:dipeptidyl aminopeptidase/acylaminoacyl peptidase